MTSAQLMVAMRVLLGAIVGWMTTPLLWLYLTPWSFAAFILANAWAKTALNPDAVVTSTQLTRDGAGTVNIRAGVLLIDGRVAPYAITGPEEDWRLSPFWSGVASAKIFAAYASSHWKWALWLRIPIIRDFVGRLIFLKRPAWVSEPDINLVQAAWKKTMQPVAEEEPLAKRYRTAMLVGGMIAGLITSSVIGVLLLLPGGIQEVKKRRKRR